ncbi:hypothetical protein PR003_g16620 [Phytophthora rubi]|uniref:Uncharacterized protein n=1 Tax=Phytophthora rubi TaxID=129364 RepID=A0A6A4EN44_9STRA|nr:hypothetical protein PR002_g16175 [Phytophthora rubi]KAE9009018.1 hypothetical protein PR001_g16551 [Phytophthora rubi]KAE9324872.1 hypothetical protein PR003_g16620 [Phytophthora rubi]
MHPRSALSRPSPKRSVSCAGLDDLGDLFHGAGNARAHPNRKRHHSLNNDNNLEATNFASSEHEYPAPPASYPGALRRPELSSFSEKNSTSGAFQVAPSSSSTFEPRYRQAPSNQCQAIEQQHPNSDEEDNNYQEEHSHDFNNEFSGGNGNFGGAHDYKSSFSALSQEPQDVFEHKLKLDHDALSAKRFKHTVFLLPSHRSASECSPREEFLIQAFGPSGFKLHGGTSVSSNDELDGSFSDDSSNNNREHNSPDRGGELADADSELKMSFNELEADIRDSMHQQQQHASRLPELVELPQQPFPSSSQGPFGLNLSASYSRNNQDMHRAPLFGQSQDTRPRLAQDQKVPRYFSREQQHHTPSSQDKSLQQSKTSGGVQIPTKWLRDEDERLRVAVARFGGKNWKMIAETLGNGRTDVQCLHRWNKVLKPGLIKGPWTPEEDRILSSLITRYGVGKIRWCDLALHLPGRIGKQCRERWCNHLDSRIRKGQWTPEEDDMVFRWQQKLGNKWSEIAKLLPGRTENAVKNRFNSAARRKWLMNQANKGSPAAQSTPVAQNSSQMSPHMDFPQQQNMMLQPPPGHQEGNVYNVGSISYAGGKVTPLPSTGVLVGQREEHHAHTMIPPLGRQTLGQQYTLSPGMPATDGLLSDGSRSILRSSLSVGDEQRIRQDHDKHPDIGKNESMPTFMPRPLNSLFHPPVINAATGTTRTLHHLASGPVSSEGAIRPVFPLPVYLPTLLQHDSSDIEASTKNTSTEKVANLALIQMKAEKIERDDLVLEAAAADVPAATDTSVPMDDENMNSFLDSVALELDDIME